MKLIQFFLQHSRKIVLWSLAFGVLSGISNALLLAVINSALKTTPSATRVLVWSFIGLCLILPVSRFASETLLNNLGQDALYKLRMQLSHQIIAAPLRHLEQLGAHRLLATLTDDIPAITNTILVVPLLCVNSALVVGCLAYMGVLSWMLLAIVLGFMTIGIASYQLPVLKAQRVLSQAREDADSMLKHFRALTQGTKELKIHGPRRHAFLNEVLEATANSFRHHNLAGMRIYTAAASWGQTLVFVVIGLIVFGLPRMQHLTVSTLTGYTLALLYLMTPLQVIMNMLPGLGRANVAINKVKELGFALTAETSEDVTTAPLADDRWDRLELLAVTHAYHSESETEAFTLGPVNLTFFPGEIVFITGGNGSGKTTLAKLLAGLYAPEAGEIRLYGRVIDDGKREFYRAHFSVVFSDCFLFEQLLGMNETHLDEKATTHLTRLGLVQKVQVKNGTFSTIDLSQGQRKRLALLTAYLEDRPIYLFDEWAADQDPHFKNVFYLEILPELKARGKTVLVISHDDRYYHVGDRVIKLEQGQVVSDHMNSPSAERVEVAAQCL